MIEYKSSSDSNKNSGLAIAAILVVASSAFAATIHPMLPLVFLIAAGAIIGSVWQPDIATMVVAFLIYTNAAVVAVQFHGVPYMIGAAVLATLLVPFVSYVVFQRQRIVVTATTLLMLVFLGVQLLGIAVAVRFNDAMDIVFVSVTEGAFLFFVLTNVIRRFEVLRGVIWAIVIAGGLLGGLTFLQNVTRTFDNNYGGFAQVSNAAFRTSAEDALFEEEQPRLEGPIGEQNRYAQNLIMLVPLGLMLATTERNQLLRLLALVALALTAIGTALTFSRGAAVGFVLAVLIMTLFGYVRVKYVLGIALGVFLLFQVVPDYGTRLSSLLNLTALAAPEEGGGIEDADTATQSRVTEMLAAGLLFMDHPVIGVGPGMYRYYYREYAAKVGIRVHDTDRYAHSLVPGLASEHGVLGLGAFFGVIGVTLFGLARVRRQTLKSRPERANLAAAFIMVILLYLTTGIFLHFGYVRFFWLMMALANAVLILSEQEAREAKRAQAFSLTGIGAGATVSGTVRAPHGGTSGATRSD